MMTSRTLLPGILEGCPRSRLADLRRWGIGRASPKYRSLTVASRITRTHLVLALGLWAFLASAAPAGAVVRYVNASAPPGGNGQSWATAYDTFGEALAAAQSGDQIWVV